MRELEIDMPYMEDFSHSTALKPAAGKKRKEPKPRKKVGFRKLTIYMLMSISEDSKSAKENGYACHSRRC
jgi:hypothetical protein